MKTKWNTTSIDNWSWKVSVSGRILLFCIMGKTTPPFCWSKRHPSKGGELTFLRVLGGELNHQGSTWFLAWKDDEIFSSFGKVAADEGGWRGDDQVKCIIGLLARNSEFANSLLCFFAKNVSSINWLFFSRFVHSPCLPIFQSPNLATRTTHPLNWLTDERVKDTGSADMQ